MSRSTALLAITLAALPAFVFAEPAASHPQHQATDTPFTVFSMIYTF